MSFNYPSSFETPAAKRRAIVSSTNTSPSNNNNSTPSPNVRTPLFASSPSEFILREESISLRQLTQAPRTAIAAATAATSAVAGVDCGTAVRNAFSNGLFYGLPDAIRERYEAKGVRQLYEWQEEVVTHPDVVKFENFVYSLPTSGGKTLVAEILLLRTLLLRGLSGMFILPYVSIVEEKIDSFTSLLEDTGIVVEGYCGASGRMPPPAGPALYICTIEKSNGVLNHLLEEKRIEELGCVVVDELHMVADTSRGSLLEIVITKLRCPLCRHIQIVGMSATIPNLNHLAHWMNAARYEGTFRPVQLKQHMVAASEVIPVGSIINKADDEVAGPAPAAAAVTDVRRLSASRSEFEMLIELLMEVYPTHSCLIFCATKAQCVDTSKAIVKHLHSKGVGPMHPSLPGVLCESVPTPDATLLQTLSYGVAFHHSGLLGEEREVIEEAFKSKKVVALCCTSTLAAGINLPARRVIFKSPYVGTAFIRKSQYLQMCGRAGRAGLDEFGESYLITQPKDRHRAMQLVRAAVEEIHSSLTPDDPECLMSRFLLECLASGLAYSHETAMNCAEKLLRFYEAPDEVTQLATMSLQLLVNNQFITKQASEEGSRGNDPLFHITDFGMSVFKANLPIPDALLVFGELKNIMSCGLVLQDDLHLCYILTPIRDLIEPEWGQYLRLFNTLSPARHRIAELLGVSERLIHQRASGVAAAMNDTSVADRRLHFTTRRFYVALIFSDMLQEVPLDVLASTYKVTRGQLQALMKAAAYFSSCMTQFASSMGWHSLEAVLSAYVKRIGYGVKPDLIPLMEIKGVQTGRARLLWNAGFRSVKHIALAEPNDLVTKLKATAQQQASGMKNAIIGQRVLNSVKFFGVGNARRLIESAKELLQLHTQTKIQEIQDMDLDGRFKQMFA